MSIILILVLLLGFLIGGGLLVSLLSGKDNEDRGPD